MIKIGHKKAGIIFGATLALFAGGNVYAADEDNGAGLNRLMPELITTARRGEESVLDVPLSITTLNAEELQAAQIVNLSDVANATPGFSFQNYFGENLSVPTIRGVSQVDIFGDPNAPVYVDGIYISSAINFGFLDFERIEILRGPQPAFFGYNAFSGAVNFVTAKPGDDLELKGEIAVGSDDKRLVSVSVSGPLVSDRLSGRVSAMFDDFSSTYSNSNPNTNQDIGGHEYKIFSGSLFFTPTDSFDAHLNVYVSDDHIDPPAMNQVPANCEPELNSPTDPLSANPNRLLNFCGAIPTVSENGLATTVGETGEVREILRTSLNMDWDIGVGTISSLTGYSENKGEILASTDRGVAGTVFAYQSTTPGFIPGSFVLGTFEAPAIQGSAGESKAEDFSQEFRFSSPQDNRFRYTVGAYLRSTETTSPIIEGFGAWAGADSLPADINLLFGFFPDLCPCIEFIPGAGIGISAGFGGFIFSDIFSAAAPGLAYINRSETDLWAGFFSTEYDIRDNLSAGFQGRYTDYEETFIDGNSPPASAVERYKDDFFNWRADLTFSPNELTIVYGSIAQGVKQGGIESFTAETINPDLDCPGPQCVDNVTQNREFGQEDILTYELGYKSVFNDGNFIVEGTVFYSDWKDIVLPQIIEMVDGKAITPEGVSGNIGDGSIFGVELQVTSQFSQAFRGGLGVSYNRARFDKGEIESFTGFPSFAPRGNAAGQTLSRQPEFQSNANATYRTQFRGGWDIYARGDVSYQSRWFVGLPNQARIPGRYRTNARVGVESDRYTVELWVNNLFDDDTVESAFRDVYLTNALPDGTNNFSTLFPWRLTVSHPQRRTYGLTMRGRF